MLRPGGVCYFAAGHALQVIEPHHRLPFLSLLPRRAADTGCAWCAAGYSYRREIPTTVAVTDAVPRVYSAATLDLSGDVAWTRLHYGFRGIARLPSALQVAIGAIAVPLSVAPTRTGYSPLTACR